MTARIVYEQDHKMPGGRARVVVDGTKVTVEVGRRDAMGADTWSTVEAKPPAKFGTAIIGDDYDACPRTTILECALRKLAGTLTDTYVVELVTEHEDNRNSCSVSVLPVRATSPDEARHKLQLARPTGHAQSPETLLEWIESEVIE